MADYNANIAPFINETFYITAEFGEERPVSGGGVRYHNGLDIATPSSLGNVDLFSVCDGTIIEMDYDDGTGTGFGNYFIIKDDNSGLAFLYGHLDLLDPVMFIGRHYSIGEYVGKEGTTGSSTGIHLHFAIQNIGSGSWDYNAPIENYENPADFMGVPNEEGISIYYNGVPKYKKKRGFPWVLYAKKLRNRGKIY